MLDEKDLQAIQSLLERSESRMMARMDRLDSRMDQFDSRMDRLETRMDRLETRMDQLETRVDQLGIDLKDTESRIMAYIESAVMPKFDRLADGHKMLAETMAPKSRVDELEGEITFLKPLVLSTLTDVDKLKKAQ